MAQTRFQRICETEQEARDWAADYKQSAWGYDPSIAIFEMGGEWIVEVTQSESCD